jgi:CheY-like chemotaxis protein
MNLVTNASEAIGDRDGVIRLTVRQVRVGRSAAITQGVVEGDYVQLEVADTGRGMSQETQARVFDPFFSTKSAGRGLGLAVVHGIVRGLGGGVHIISEPAKGATFQVLLPCCEVAAAETTANPVGEKSASLSQKFTVLVVEDEDLLRQAVVKMLHKTGSNVLEAANGSAAIDLLRADPAKIDIILLDMTLPGASSREVIAEAARDRPEVRVILTSAYSQEMMTPLMSSSLVRGFIRKPYELRTLVQTLRNTYAA